MRTRFVEMPAAATTERVPADIIITMRDAAVYTEKLLLFGQLLRQEGLKVSPRETEDACRLLAELGFEERETVKAALRAIYAASREEQLRFDRVFDSFFLPEEAIRALDAKHRAEERRQAEARAEAERTLTGERGDLLYNAAQKDAYAALPAEEKERLQKLREKYMGEGARNPELYGNFIHSVFARSILEQQMAMEDAAVGAAPVDPELGLMVRDIAQFSDAELPKAVAHIQELSRRINGELAKKRRASSSGGVIDFRGTLRKGLETGGTLYRLKYKTRRRKKQQLLLLCDVSASMIRFSEFALRLIRSISEAAGSSRVFLFSEGVFEADAFHLRNMELFRDYVRSSGLYGRGTGLGAALHELNARVPPLLAPSTLLLIVSDAKTTDEALALHELAVARKAAGRVVLLNPIPERKWKYLRSVETLRQECTMLSCSTLRELDAACRKLLI